MGALSSYLANLSEDPSAAPASENAAMPSQVGSGNRDQNQSKEVFRGIVKTWMDDKGFGWITPEQGLHEVFVHQVVLHGGIKRLERGSRVEYQSKYDVAGGKYACTMCRLPGAAPQQTNEMKWDTERGMWTKVSDV